MVVFMARSIVHPDPFDNGNCICMDSDAVPTDGNRGLRKYAFTAAAASALTALSLSFSHRGIAALI